MIRVALIGPESTGKSTLARALAAHYRTIAVPEYGRIYCEIFGNDCDADDLRAILEGQLLLEAAAERKARGLMILDTDAVMTAVWSEVLLGRQLPEFATVGPAAFYLLTDIDVPFEADAIRYFPDEAERRRMFELCRSKLERRTLPYTILHGDHETRQRTAIEAIDAHFPPLP